MNNIPLKPVTLKTVNRFPAIYKIQAQQAIRYEVHEAIKTTADSFAMTSLIALIEEFDFGTNERATKIHRFIKRLQKVIDVSADFYDEAIANGLENKLNSYGVKYKRN